MQFLFKYIEDLVGKGLEWYVVLELIVYASSTLVPMALPLAILLSSIMTFGNLGEHYELVALKSAGISLRKIMMPLVYCVLLISIGAFYFSNVAMPYANLKMGALMWDVKNQKPTLALKEGVFFNGMDGFSIRVGKKRSTVTNYLRLLKLDPILQTGIRDGFISMGHGRALINIKSTANQLDIYEKILLDKLSVRQTEELVKSLKIDKKIPNEIKKHLPNYIKNSLPHINSYLGHKVNVTINGKGKGKISIPFHSKEDFERIKNLLK